MMNLKNLCVLIVLAKGGLVQAVTSYDPQDWSAYVLKLSPEGTVKDVFDSGLRPWLPPGFETSYLGFKHARVTVQTHEQIILPEVPVEYSEIYSTQDGRLHSIMMVSPGLPFEMAKQQILPWLGKIGKTEKELERFFDIVRDNPIGYEDRDFGKAPDGFSGLWVDSGRVKYLAGFNNNRNPNQPLRFVFSITWFNLRSNRDRYRVHVEPIKPPPGYENVSLTPPKKWGPDSTLEKMRALDLDTGESPEAVAEQRRNGERPPLKGVQNSKPDPPPARISPPATSNAGSGLFVIIALGIAVACLLAWWYLKRKQPAV